MKEIEKGVDIIVSTPGRLVTLLEHRPNEDSDVRMPKDKGSGCTSLLTQFRPHRYF